ncbi:MAG: hypothetical protein ACLSVD_01245 [Eggerthellaceae bacterium]
MKLLFRKTERPVLAYVPIVSLWAPWESGILRPPAVMSLVKDAAVLVDGEVDYTIHIDVATGLCARSWTRSKRSSNACSNVMRRSCARCETT